MVSPLFALVALFSNVLRVQIDLHFTKVQEILFKNFCSLAPVLSIFGAPVALSSKMGYFLDLWYNEKEIL